VGEPFNRFVAQRPKEGQNKGEAGWRAEPAAAGAYSNRRGIKISIGLSRSDQKKAKTRAKPAGVPSPLQQEPSEFQGIDTFKRFVA